MNAPRTPHVSGRFRVNTCGLLGLAAGAATASFQPWQLAVLVGWLTLAASLLGWIWYEVADCDAEHTRLRSTIEDTTHLTANAVVVAASTISLVGVAFGLAKARHVGHNLQVVMTVCAVAAVVLSWLVVHSMFTLRFAHEYYRDESGGLVFPGGEDPDYVDFAYFAFTIGMAFAVSDVQIASRVMRRVALRQQFISYLFSAVIVGLVINVMASFVR